jgi:hypothetical protein
MTSINVSSNDLFDSLDHAFCAAGRERIQLSTNPQPASTATISGAASSSSA